MGLSMKNIEKTDAKFFIRYKDDENIRPLFIKFPKMNWHVNSFKDKHISFETKKNGFIETYTKVWDRVNNIIEKAFDTQPVFEEKHLKPKLNYYNNKKTHFFNKKST